MGRSDWEPLPLEYLEAEKQAARAARDERTLTLIREISRLHWVAIRANHLVLTLTIPGSNIHTIESIAQDVRRVLEKEPAIIKDNRIRFESTRKPPGTAYSAKLEDR